MPFLGIERTGFILTTKKLGNHKFNAYTAIKSGFEVVGDGIECFVLPRSGHPDKVQVIQWSEHSAKEAKTDFYWHRIFSTLFPHNFPHIHAAFGNPAENPDREILTGNIRQKITGWHWNEEASNFTKLKLSIKGLTRSIFKPDRKSFAQLEQECTKWQLPLRFDDYLGNFITTPGGDEYFVDTLERSFGVDIKGLNNCAIYARKNNYTETDVKIIERSIARIKTISAQQD